MGMYTELVLKCSFKNDTPQEALGVIRHLFAGGPLASQVPDHPFFSKPRWDHIGSLSSYYHHPKAINDLHDNFSGLYLFSRSDLKNYDGEIEAFLDWVDPYVDERPGQCIGWSWYEEDLSPTLVYKKGEPS